MNQTTVFSPGKVIISGEHSVGAGEPALVATISLGVTVSLETGSLDPQVPYAGFVKEVFQIFANYFKREMPALNVKVDSTIPFGCGLGSSAAFGHALFKALGQHYDVTIDQPTMLKLVQTSENYAHGEASGVDSTAVVVGGLIEFRKKVDGFDFRQLSTEYLQQLSFFLINSGKPVETTKEMVTIVRGHYAHDPQVPQVIKDMGTITKQFISDLDQNTFRPELLNQNQVYLEQIGIVSEDTKLKVATIQAEGGFVKVTGAGGVQAGSGMMLAYHLQSEKFAKFLDTQGWTYYQVKLGVI